mmetsp:Transcript_48048/g.84204  ORF Transcript_48048/g.84204 Transcript_48048/m.84204 type:complete len:294 (-) Transcript_48048:259-1140(-)
MNAFLLLLFLLLTVCYGNEMLKEGKMASMRIIISSAAGNTDRRHACRMTWLKWVKHLQQSVGYSFYVDVPKIEADRVRIEEEAAYFKDIVLLNATGPDDFGSACSFRRWEALAIEHNHFQDKIDFYTVADDDSFICIHHLMSDSKYWPVSKRVHIGHFFGGGPDVISIYSSLLVKDALQIVSANAVLKFGTLFMMSPNIADVDNINDLRFAYGAKGKKEKRHNDLKNGWVGEDLLNSTEKSSVCNSYLSLHQVYPNLMIDLWSHIAARPVPAAFTVPELSRDTRNLDTSIGYR